MPQDNSTINIMTAEAARPALVAELPSELLLLELEFAVTIEGARVVDIYGLCDRKGDSLGTTVEITSFEGS